MGGKDAHLMARATLGPASLEVAGAVRTVVGPAMDVPTKGRLPSRLVIGVSGGPDSLALAAATAWAVTRSTGALAGVEAGVVVVDHGLQDGSARIARTAADQVAGLGLPVRVETVRVDVSRGGPEAGARRARYAALLADRDALVLTGHTLDDQAETVLLGLARGSGTRSLAGMATTAGRLVRPLLTVRRATTEQACREWGLTWWTDPHNSDPAYARARVRSGMGTLEAALGPGFAEALARTATLCRQDADLLDAWAVRVGPQVRAEGGADLVVDGLLGVPGAVRSRVVLSWLRTQGVSDATMAHVVQVCGLADAWHGQGPIDVPGARVVRTGGLLRLTPDSAGGEPSSPG